MARKKGSRSARKGRKAKSIHSGGRKPQMKPGPNVLAIHSGG